MVAEPLKNKPTKRPTAESLLAALVNSSDDAMLTKDLNGVITSWNKAAERIFGYSSDEIIGRPILLLVPGDLVSEEADILRRVLAGDRIDHFETVRLVKGGKVLEVSISVSPIKDDEGSIVGASQIARDMTELRRGARADLLLAAIVSSSDDAILSKSLEGIITSWNAGAKRIFGYDAEEMIGQPVMKLIPRDRLDEEPKILERLRRGERVDHFETIRVRKNGEHFPVSLTISPVRDPLGKIVGASKIARDITNLKQFAAEREQLLESERAARSHAENANRMKDEFLSTVSHELRTPLNAIVGWTEVIEGGDQNREEVIHGVQVIKRNAMMQAQLIEDLLDLGRISSGMMRLEIEPIDIGAVVADAIASVAHAVRTKHLTITKDIRNVGGLLGDSKRLQQVIWNLLANAIKFTPSGGKIHVRASRKNSHVELAIADSGQGISAKFIPHLFERFSQADASTTRSHGGLGIGLALVKQLVELHGGKVQAESPGEGMGATFTLLLPIAALQGGARSLDVLIEEKVVSGVSTLKGIKVMAVDDDKDSLGLIKRILARQGAEVETAASVDEALEVFSKFLPDVILSDIGMPEKDGYELIRLIREHPSGAATPAAALTALARIDDRTRALTAGYQNHLSKPVAAAEVVAVVYSLARIHPRGQISGLPQSEGSEAN
jgi:PAS domain S-box-containing protein